MNFQRRKAVSPIIATLLLIAIAVAAGIIVYVFVNGLAGNLTAGGGQQTTERLQMQSYNFAINPFTPGFSAITCGCSTWLVQIYMLNSGTSSTTISAVYYNGVLQTLAASPSADTALATGNAYTAATNAVIGNAGTTGTCAAPTGVSDTDKICFTNSGAFTTYAAGATGEVVIAFSAAQTGGTTNTIKIVSTTGATYVFNVVVGRAG
jgi:flagellin-like protein